MRLGKVFYEETFCKISLSILICIICEDSSLKFQITSSTQWYLICMLTLILDNRRRRVTSAIPVICRSPNLCLQNHKARRAANTAAKKIFDPVVSYSSVNHHYLTLIHLLVFVNYSCHYKWGPKQPFWLGPHLCHTKLMLVQSWSWRLRIPNLRKWFEVFFFS